jgi:hypothetical protein
VTATVEEVIPRLKFVEYDGSNAADALNAGDPDTVSGWSLDWETGGQARFYRPNDNTVFFTINTGEYLCVGGAGSFGPVSSSQFAGHYIPVPGA